jgi:hypothetical protein
LIFPINASSDFWFDNGFINDRLRNNQCYHVTCDKPERTPSSTFSNIQS